MSLKISSMAFLFLLLTASACQQPADSPTQPRIGTPVAKNQPREEKARTNPGAPNSSRTRDNGASADNSPFDRHPNQLILTRHARCRMDCRHINEKEIREILDHGEINDRKSDPNAHPDPKYAVEGNSDEGQHLRIVVAVPHKDRIKESAGSVLVVVTVIELGVEWQCNCH